MKSRKQQSLYKKIAALALTMLVTASLTACSGGQTDPASDTIKLQAMPTKLSSFSGLVTEIKSMDNKVILKKAGKNVWIHTSYKSINGNKVPANGLIVQTKQGIVLLDATWSDKLAGQLVHMIESYFKQKVVLAIVTHAHEDRMGGVSGLIERDIEVRSTDMTARLAKEAGYAEPNAFLDGEPQFMVGGTQFEVFYPGEGHGKDNVVVWLPQTNTLFGGCLVLGQDAKALGNVADANMAEWPESLLRVKHKYGQAKLVVPGHGKWGNAGLLNRSIELVSKSNNT
ncbi:subclass B1 metallo-beta-lactamase [Paenibacillus sp. 481]|uniref:subclass B1 metallo-beta-lactamase n=1 Tax=Paenibacillus sp. 481 TaxID=2835869 RepID=UPI001E4F8C07|nr:subclass B1 metallo-beta-lactamase [Paenibacillus sp. 481]UHA74980.1 subclass B1 metallo-beta-lactamase [Paenibacillus sp. 481]